MTISALATSLDFQLRLPAVQALLLYLFDDEQARKSIPGACHVMSDALVEYQALLAGRLSEAGATLPSSALDVADRSTLPATPETQRYGADCGRRIARDLEFFAAHLGEALEEARARQDAPMIELLEDLAPGPACVLELVKLGVASLERCGPPRSRAAAEPLAVAVRRALATASDLSLRAHLASWYVWSSVSTDELMENVATLMTNCGAGLAQWLTGHGLHPDASARAMAAGSMLPLTPIAGGLSFVAILRMMVGLHELLAAVLGDVSATAVEHRDAWSAKAIDSLRDRLVGVSHALREALGHAENEPELHVAHTPRPRVRRVRARPPRDIDQLLGPLPAATRADHAAAPGLDPLCPDEACIGIVGPDRRCRVCGRAG
jgi:hypothetical protein